jgi:hypothetical protein
MANKQTIIGKTAPVPLGQQRALNSLPVVFAEDQPPIPVEEQNKIQSEVALSLLGIPRAEVALGIFADVNTYDINPTEWSQSPLENDPETGTGLYHIAQEAGAELVASEGRTTILTSKRFFRYQPGRVSSSTMGVRMNRTGSTYDPNTPAANIMKGAPTIKKWGIFDKFDGYYFEIVNSGDNNDFRCVRRTQALVPTEPSGVGATPDGWNRTDGSTDKVNIKGGNWGVVGEDPVIFRNGLCYVAAAIYDPSLCFSPENVRTVENDPNKLSEFDYNEDYAVRLAYRDSAGDFIEHLQGRQFQFPFDQKESGTFTESEYQVWENDNLFLKPQSQYIRLDTHCRWEDIVTNLSRGGGANFNTQIGLTGINNSQLNVTPSSPRFGYDNAPSAEVSGVKIWNLLVSVQGPDQITNAQYSAAFPTPHRTLSYSVSSTDVGRKNITLKEWFKICVPPQYRTVYEWRPVRAMFSNDQLNGNTTNTVRWSDVSTANVDPVDVGVKRPGSKVVVNGRPLIASSVYNVDFTKVTMWKIEFSWYGAVGALFLCYVPVGNGEARWVRVHHMRASNQLDVASLGNATLPITYLTHSGIQNDLIDQKSILVKYGASYYIDGGDKGTVKLVSKSSDFQKQVKYGIIKTIISSVPSSNYFSIPTSAIPQSQKDQLIGAYLKNDTITKVIWVENDSTDKIKLYFNRSVSLFSENDTIDLVIPRRQRSMISLRAKDQITNTSGTPIRNRIQIYPIKYSTGITDSSSDNNILTVNFLKNPLVITNNLNNSTLSQSYNISLYNDPLQIPFGFDLGSGTVPKLIGEDQNISESDYSILDSLLPNDGSYAHFYMRSIGKSQVGISGFSSTPTVMETPSLVRIFKKGSSIYIQNFASKPESFTVFGPLIPVRMYTFDQDGNINLFSGTPTHKKYEDQNKWNESAIIGSFESIGQLSGASVSQDFRMSPVSDTGSLVFSLYTNKGGSQYNLEDYFAYNKEYISYPLTNEVDIMCAYALWESTSSNISPAYSISMVNSLTWEEQ